MATTAIATPRRAIDVWTIMVVIAIVGGAALRLWNLGGPSISHPEIFIPGIDLIPGISVPPPRHGFLETLDWQFRSEGHPVGYYMAMWGWAKLAGTSELGLRLSSAALGVATIWALWRLGLAVFGRRIAAVAALLIALQGFHVFWSQVARVYVMAGLFAVLATWALVELTRKGENRPWLEAGYVVALIAGTQTVELFWAIPFLHVAWVALVTPGGRLPALRSLILPWAAPASRIVQVQAMALALAAPDFVHSAMHIMHRSDHAPAPQFLLQYLDFGFLFQWATYEPTDLDQPFALILALAVIAATLAFFGMRARNASIAQSRSTPLPFSRLVVAVAAGAGVALLLAAAADRRQAALATLAVLPVMTLWLPGLAALVRPLIERVAPPLARVLDRLRPFSLLLLMLALVPPVIFWALSFAISMLVPRGFLHFVPFYLLLVAAGLMQLPRARVAQTIALAAISALFLASAAYFRALPPGPQDYKGAAAIIARERRPDDVILIRKENWVDTPIFYYLRHAHYVAEDHAAFLVARHPPRVWLPQWLSSDGVAFDSRYDALHRAGYAETRSWAVQGARAILYERTAP